MLLPEPDDVSVTNIRHALKDGCTCTPCILVRATALAMMSIFERQGELLAELWTVAPTAEARALDVARQNRERHEVMQKVIKKAMDEHEAAAAIPETSTTKH